MLETSVTGRSKPQPRAMPSARPSIHPIIHRLFEKRGWGPNEIQAFLSWDLKQLPDLCALKDLSKASERICEAIANGEQIGIYGDYDVDGTTSCALFYQFFKSINVEVICIQPSRFIEGYGLHVESIDKAQEKGIKVLITVDCGITSCEAADYALERQLDLIITDHHKDAKEHMPRALAVINPNRRDEPQDSPLKALAGVAVAFCLCMQVRKDLLAQGQECPSLYPLLQFVAIGTICDLVPLNFVNIKLVRHGLKQMLQTDFHGIKAFFTPDERERPLISSEKLSFHIGPMINSKGRLDHPEKALELLLSHNHEHAFACYSQLDICNKERKFIQAEVYQSTRDQIVHDIESQAQGAEHYINFAYDPEWHEGVIGIVASKLVEDFKVPSIVFTDSEDEGLVKASARAAGEVSMFDLLKECESLFVKFGGHRAAAGLSMPKENLPELKQKLIALLAQMPAQKRTRQERFDLEIRPEDITPKLVKDLDLLEPFGNLNERPMFKMSQFHIESFDLLKDVHVRWQLRSLGKNPIRMRGISFNYINKWGIMEPDELLQVQKHSPLTAYFTLGINYYKGNEYVQLMIERITVEDKRLNKI